MKIQTQKFLLIAALFIAGASCTKPNSPVPPVVVPAEKNYPIQVEVDGNFSNVNYNTDGTIQSIVTSTSAGTINANYIFSYENGKIKEINFGAKWKYTYTGDNLTKIETFIQGALRYTYGFTYVGDKLVERIDYLSPVSLTPQFKTKYTYRADGNVEKKEVFQYTNNTWHAVEEIYYSQYDQNANVTESLGSYPYLPPNMFSPNNPVKETWMSGGVLEQTVEHTYTYDAKGRPKTRKSISRFPSLPDEFSEVKILY